MKKRSPSLLLAFLLALTLLGPVFQTAQAAPNAASNGRPYYIMVNRTMNTVTVYGLDANGYYTVPVKAMICSVGRSGSVTPRGTFSVAAKMQWCHMIDGSYGQYATQFYGNYLFHSVCYTAANPSTLMTYEYNMLGNPASLGCVRLQTADAKWIYDNCAAGTKVTVYDGESPGPLGKPDKLLSYIPPEMDIGWDPTDPRENNPWHRILVSGLSLRTKDASVFTGETLSLSAALTPSTATYPWAVWTSSNPSVASVDSGGHVTALKPGTAVITVACGNVTDTCTVKVTEKPLLPFTDVPVGAWYFNDVRYVYEAGAMGGTSATTFSPGMQVTRTMAKQELSRLFGEQDVTLPSDSTTTGAARPITRQELAVMLYQYETIWCGRPASGLASLSQYADGKNVDSSAVDAVSWAVGNRLIQGTAQKTLNPSAYVTRAQEAAILHRYHLYRQSN